METALIKHRHTVVVVAAKAHAVLVVQNVAFAAPAISALAGPKALVEAATLVVLSVSRPADGIDQPMTKAAAMAANRAAMKAAKSAKRAADKAAKKARAIAVYKAGAAARRRAALPAKLAAKAVYKAKQHAEIEATHQVAMNKKQQGRKAA